MPFARQAVAYASTGARAAPRAAARKTDRCDAGTARALTHSTVGRVAIPMFTWFLQRRCSRASCAFRLSRPVRRVSGRLALLSKFFYSV
jgi:hypothetical protein